MRTCWQSRVCEGAWPHGRHGRRTARRLLLVLACLAGLPAAAAPPEIQSRPLSEVALYPERSALAQVVSLNESRIAAEISAPILEIPVQPGESIGKGAVIVRLDCRDPDLAAERARAAVAVAEAHARLGELQSRRAGKLAEDNFISTELLDTRRAEADAARAELTAARTALKSAERTRGKCTLRSPFPAIVVERLGQVGETAAAGTPLVRLFDRSRIELRAAVAQTEVAELARAAEPRFATAAGELPVRLRRSSPAVDPATRQVEVRLRFTKGSAAVGSSGRLRWRSPAPHVPAELLVRRQGGLGIYVIDARAPRFLPLPDAEEGRPAAVSLPLATRILTRGQHTLR